MSLQMLTKKLSKRKILTDLLAQHLIPVILQHGFEPITDLEIELVNKQKVRLPFGRFRRVKGPNYELLEIKFDKGFKPKFIINFGVVPQKGIDLPWGHFNSNQISASWAPEAAGLYE